MKSTSINCSISGFSKCVGCKNSFGALYDKYNGIGDVELCDACELND
jgi:hypothetical protein